MAFVSAHQQQDDYLKSLASLAAVANENDMTDMLYVDFAKHDRPFIVNEAAVEFHQLMAESLTPLSTPSTAGAQTPLFDHAGGADEEEAVLSDLPFDSDSDLEIPPSPPTGQRRHRGATSLGEDDFEFPVFLGRQSMDAGSVGVGVDERRPVPSGPMRPMLPRAAPLRKATTAPAAPVPEAAAPAAPAVPELSGPMMAWWPAPVESLQYDWVEAAAPSKAQVPVEAHVTNLEGPLMTWWPAPAELMEYEWKEKFYE